MKNKILRNITLAKLIAVACPATFVPFRQFLKPSFPHEVIATIFPLLFVASTIVLFFETRM